MISLGFILTSLLIIIIPGTGVIYTISTGIVGTKKDSIIAAIGCTVGIVPHLIASIVGLSAIFHMSALVFQTIKIIGIVYLLYLGWSMIKDKDGFKINNVSKDKSTLKIIVKAILINMLNPKLTLFFFSFIPQFIQNNKHGYMYQMIILSLIFMGLTLIVFILYGILANYFKRLIVSSPKITHRIQQLFGLIFIGMAIKLALSDD
ncbi:LysE family translocator [Mobilitalea sibirica]|uniref:LysE family translocator n=1 Tax=Mobilitalea sibirica TaxID=1462919 RepID=A0A8J7L3G5_9FIRM|nr:LysE family translocator [Mobilitalea sibirica]MBH1942578.1 LysE family translocator [Mobilitalea sibirica]